MKELAKGGFFENLQIYDAPALTYNIVYDPLIQLAKR